MVKIRSRQASNKAAEQKLSGIKANLLLLQQIFLPFESWEGGTNTSIFRELNEESMNFWPQSPGTICCSLKGTRIKSLLNPSIARLEEPLWESPDLV